MRKEDISNEIRKKELSELGPRYSTTDKDNGTTHLVKEHGDSSPVPVSNNPRYWPNMVDRMNTPFDHLERILLQDFSSTMDIGGEENYFKSLFKFGKNEGESSIGVASIGMSDSYGADYSKVDELLGEENGEFFIDSFTYTPFIDYSQTEEGGDSRVGVYSDRFLNDYNSGKYDKDSRWFS